MSQSNAFLTKIPFIEDLGVEFISSGSGIAVMALSLEPRHLNSWAVAHGGVLMSLLDVAMAAGGRTVFPEAGAGITIEMKTTFLQPANAASRLMATGRCYHRSKTMAFCEGEICDHDDRLIAKATGIFKYRKARAAHAGGSASG